MVTAPFATHINITQVSVAETIDVEQICAHPNAYIEQPCCTARGDSGLVECACGGVQTVVCPDCNNKLTEAEIEAIITRER